MIKNTDEMQQEILNADNIYDMLENNRESFSCEALSDYLKKLLEEKNIKPAEAVRRSGLDRSYGHQIISGRKAPSRDKLIALSFGMELSLDETNALLKASRNRTLYARDQRDAVIIYALANKLSIIETNQLLFDKSIEIIS
ncbi:MAG: helix-turn-helix domain-containing protein [Huintestinicola sp.]|uniref:helix-turn-helix domain-containing protein n=1 Tax=Huintestinicola sp. TaxID=2981661 RepID=UPI003EFD70CF